MIFFILSLRIVYIYFPAEAQHIDHDKKVVKPPKDKEPKPLPPKHDEHNKPDKK